MDPGRAYSTAGSAHSIPTSAPGMYDYTNGGGTQSTSLNSSLESHMSQLSKTMLQLAQTNQVMANHQCQNHQAMVDVQKQQTEAFNTLAGATEQRKYDNLFTAIPKFDGTNKENCAIWLSQVDQLVTSTGRNLRMELLNRADGHVATMLAGMDYEVNDEDLKEEIMHCFSNAPTKIQAIQALRAIRQNPKEQARLYTAHYEALHYRANQVTADEQGQNGEMMFFILTLLRPLQRKLLKKMNTVYGPHTLREAFDLTLEFEKEYQITQPGPDLRVMETCYEDPEENDEYSTEEVQMRSQMQNNPQCKQPQGQGQNQYCQGNKQPYQKQQFPQQYNNQNSNQGNQYRNNYNQGHKQQYQQGAKQYQNNWPPQNNVFQGQGQVVNVPIPRIDCGIVIPSQWGLEQFAEMAKALKCIEDKHKYNRTYGPQQRAGGLANSHAPANSQNKENQDTNGLTVMTSRPSPITPTTQIGNITVSNLAMKMGSQMEDIVAAINEVQEAETPAKNLESQVIEPQ